MKPIYLLSFTALALCVATAVMAQNTEQKNGNIDRQKTGQLQTQDGGITVAAAAQDAAPDIAYDSNIDRLELNQQGMTTLALISAGNIIGSGFGLGTSDSELTYFHQMNIYWNVIDLLIGGYGYISTTKELQKVPKTPSLEYALAQQRKTEKLFLINAGLDVVYIAAGATLRRYGLNQNSDNLASKQRLQGYGSAVIANGGLLFVFDSIMYLLQRRSGKDLRQSLAPKQMGFAPTKSGIGVAYHF